MLLLFLTCIFGLAALSYNLRLQGLPWGIAVMAISDVKWGTQTTRMRQAD